MGALEVTSLIVYGDPNAEVREALAPFGAPFMSPAGGFHR